MLSWEFSETKKREYLSLALGMSTSWMLNSCPLKTSRSTPLPLSQQQRSDPFVWRHFVNQTTLPFVIFERSLLRNISFTHRNKPHLLIMKSASLYPLLSTSFPFSLSFSTWLERCTIIYFRSFCLAKNTTMKHFSLKILRTSAM